MRIMLLKVVVVADRYAPRWPARRIANKIVSNFEYEGFGAEVQIVHVARLKENDDGSRSQNRAERQRKPARQAR